VTKNIVILFPQHPCLCSWLWSRLCRKEKLDERCIANLPADHFWKYFCLYNHKNQNVMDPIMASIMLWPCDWEPRGWLFCNGEELSIAQNTALFSLIGTTYGGDGVTTFLLPNLQSVGSPGAEMRYIICAEGIYPSRQ